MEILFIFVIILIIVIVRMNNKGKANWIDTISVIFDNITESTIETTSKSAYMLSKASYNPTTHLEQLQRYELSVSFAVSFITIIAGTICSLAKNETPKPYDIRNIASIILEHEYLSIKLHNIYARGVTITNATRFHNEITILSLPLFKDSLRNVSKNF